MAVLPAVPALPLHHCALDTRQTVMLVQGRGEIAALPAVTAVLLHHCAMDTWADCNVVSTG